SGHSGICGSLLPGEKQTIIIPFSLFIIDKHTWVFTSCCFWFHTQLKSSAEGILNKKYEYFTAISYRSQIVAGTNFIFKIHAGGENYVHMSVFWALPCNGGGVTVMGAQENKSKTDPIVPF
uniref:Cystatin domain-containing protein n=1 Tax=Sphaeramia orbicularis TaxID=375764 RepID=A0A672ZIK6_9TELE